MVVRMWGKGNTHSLLVGVQTCTATVEIGVAASQEVENNLPQDPATPLLGIYPKDSTPYYRDTCSSMFIVAAFKTAGN